MLVYLVLLGVCPAWCTVGSGYQPFRRQPHFLENSHYLAPSMRELSAKQTEGVYQIPPPPHGCENVRDKMKTKKSTENRRRKGAKLSRLGSAKIGNTIGNKIMCVADFAIRLIFSLIVSAAQPQCHSSEGKFSTASKLFPINIHCKLLQKSANYAFRHCKLN